MEINQDSFAQVAFAGRFHQSIKRYLKAYRAEQILIHKLEAAKKETEIAVDIAFESLVSIPDDELLILAKNYPDVEEYINLFIETRKEAVSKNTEGAK
jgi:hypothetical protein